MIGIINLTLNKKLKKLVKGILNNFKYCLRLGNLNNEEKLGEVQFITPFKLIPKTQVCLPFTLGRSIRGLSFCDNLSDDPIGQIFTKLLNGVSKEQLAKDLSNLYQNEINKSAGEIVNIEKGSILWNYPAWALVMPWEKISVQEKYDSYVNSMQKNRSKHGLNINSFDRDKIMSKAYSYEAAMSQINQTDILNNSFVENPKQIPTSLPLVYILKKSSEWRWAMSGEGNHRAYIGAINGMDHFSAEVFSQVNEADVKQWNNVKNGNYNIDQALEVFELFFQGKKCLRGLI